MFSFLAIEARLKQIVFNYPKHEAPLTKVTGGQKREARSNDTSRGMICQANPRA
jgi:hypothetical protein